LKNLNHVAHRIVICGGEVLLKKTFIAEKVCTARSRTNNKTVPLTNINKYLRNGKSEIDVNINNSRICHGRLYLYFLKTEAVVTIVQVGLEQSNLHIRQSSKKNNKYNCCIHTVVPLDEGPRHARNMYSLTKYTKNKFFLYLLDRASS